MGKLLKNNNLNEINKKSIFVLKMDFLWLRAGKFLSVFEPIFKPHLFNIPLWRMPEIAFVFTAELARRFVADLVSGFGNVSPFL